MLVLQGSLKEQLYDEVEEVEIELEEEEEFGDIGDLVDDYGAVVDPDIEGLKDDKDIPEYEIIDSRSSFINGDGEISVMDMDETGENFRFMYVDIANIAIVKRIRKNKNVDSLIKSIRNTGLLEPVVVAPTATEDIYVLLAGYRRLIACARVGIRNIPCVVNLKVNSPEIPILEAIYNHSNPYGIREIIDYIEYLEKEKGIMSPSMIEFLLQLDTGDYTKLKDILNDDDDDIVSRLMAEQLTIAQAFKKLEQRRKNESKEEKDIKKAEQVYDEGEEAKQIEGSGEQSDGSELTEEEIQSLAIMINDIESDDDSLVDAIEDGKNIEGFEPHKQSPQEREILDPALRKAVLARDNNTCRCCGISGQEFVEVFDVHHVIEVYLGGTDEIDNLITVCTVCHKLIHSYGRGTLYLRPIKQMSIEEQSRFKKIVKLGNIIRRGLGMKGMKKEELKKLDKMETIGRTKPGKGQVAG